MAVQVADDTNVGQILGENSKVVVKFYADWCGSCRLFAPKFKRISEESPYHHITFLDINAEKSPEIRKEVGVTNLPFFAVFQDGKFVEGISTNKEDAFKELLAKIS